MGRVLMMGEKQQVAAPAALAAPYAASLLLGVGGALGLAGWIDVGLLWSAPNFASVDWEFGTVSATFDALPLGTIGLAAILAGSLHRPAAWPLYLTAALFWLLTLCFLAASTIYVLALPAIVGAAPAVLATTLRNAVAKTLLLAAIYTVLYAWLGLYAWRHARRPRTLG